MPKFGFALTADDRSDRGCVPLQLRNLRVERLADGTAGGQLAVVNTPGAVLRATFSAPVRGIFRADGVAGGLLFVAAGGMLYSVSDTWGITNIGPISGGGRVYFDRLRDTLLILAGGILYTYYNGALTSVSDVNFPGAAATLSTLGQRVFVTSEGSDVLAWSSTLDATSWPALAFSTAEDDPDRIVATLSLAGTLVLFGATTIQFGRVVDGDDDEAFAMIPSATRQRGCIARDSVAALDSSAFFVGDDRCVYRLDGQSPERLAHDGVEAVLMGLSEAQAAQLQGFVAYEGSRPYYVLRPPTGSAYVYDVATNSWHERTSWSRAAYRWTYYTRAYGKHIVSGPDESAIYEWRDDAFDDAGETIERVATVDVPITSVSTINSIRVHGFVTGQPLTGQGSSPRLLLTYYRDGGAVDSLRRQGIERVVTAGRAGQYGSVQTAWAFGRAAPNGGFTLRIRCTDPVRLSLRGVWVNEGRQA